ERLGENLSHLDACLDQSRRFLNDLIHLAKTGTVEMEPERVELAAVVDEVLFEQDELARQRGVRFDVRRPLPAVWYNHQRLKQIVTNLVRNAIKHGCDPHSPCIAIRANRHHDATNGNDIYPTVELRVHDNGPGIDRRFADEIFLPGKRLSQDEDGTGMGLAIVKRIAEHYGGSAWIDYEKPEGTTVAVLLPGGFSVPAAEPWMAHRLENRGAAAAGVAPPHLPRRRRAAPPSRQGH
ncbi:MAG: HAMP domain-containing histidine kinase, partial [Pirellulaceae bacterium]|nr:HAMP domain-containing histidine kinase [Pirellulaceae bacterium]